MNQNAGNDFNYCGAGPEDAEVFDGAENLTCDPRDDDPAELASRAAYSERLMADWAAEVEP